MKILEPLVKVLKIIHFAMLMGIVVLFAVIWVFTENGTTPLMASEHSAMFFYAALFVAAFAAVLGFYLHQRDIKILQTIEQVDEKVLFYRSAMIRHFAMIEGAALLSLIFFMMTADKKNMIISLFLLLYFLTLRPGLVKAKRDLGEI